MANDSSTGKVLQPITNPQGTGSTINNQTSLTGAFADLTEPSLEDVMGKNGGGALALYLYKLTNNQLTEKTEFYHKQLKEQSAEYRQQLDSLVDKFQKELESKDDRLFELAETKNQEIRTLDDEINSLTIENGILKTISPSQLWGAILTAVATLGVSLAAKNGMWLLAIILGLISVSGTVLPKFLTFLSQKIGKNSGKNK